MFYFFYLYIMDKLAQYNHLESYYYNKFDSKLKGYCEILQEKIIKELVQDFSFYERSIKDFSFTYGTLYIEYKKGYKKLINARLIYY